VCKKCVFRGCSDTQCIGDPAKPNFFHIVLEEERWRKGGKLLFTDVTDAEFHRSLYTPDYPDMRQLTDGSKKELRRRN